MPKNNIISLKKQSPFRKKDSIEHRKFLLPSVSMLNSMLKRFFYERDLLRLYMLRSYKAGFERRGIYDGTKNCKRTIQRHLKILEDLRVISYRDGVAKLKKFNKRISEEEAKTHVPEYYQSLFEKCPEMFRVSEY